ncbi:MAG: hypothetical protein JWL76_890 [Thermoleophilia bacterium]|nr:hypothetical protein [Thermoleophilia bacterium]
MATPDIGKSISEGYGRGMDRVGSWLPTLAVFAGLSALVAGVSAQVQASLVPDAEDVFKAIFDGGFDAADLRTLTLVGAVSTALNMLIGFGIYVVLGGALHRERHGADGSIPGPGSAIPALLAGIGALMPKAAILVAIMFGAQVLGVVIGTLGTLIGLVLWIAYIMLAIRWIYAPIIAGGGEATGDAAFERSEGVVKGSWWGTFGSFIVIGLATVVPFVIGGLIVGAIVPGAFLSAAASSFVIALVGMPIFASALESAWSQVEGGAGGDMPPTPPLAGEHLPPTHPSVQPPANEPPTGPFV